jgi:hypothetical protein
MLRGDSTYDLGNLPLYKIRPVCLKPRFQKIGPESTLIQALMIILQPKWWAAKPRSCDIEDWAVKHSLHCMEHEEDGKK